MGSCPAGMYREEVGPKSLKGARVEGKGNKI